MPTQDGITRRTTVKIIGGVPVVVGGLSGTTSALGSVSSSEAVAGPEEGLAADPGAARSKTTYFAERVDSGHTFAFESRDALAAGNLPEGEYELRRKRVTPGAVRERYLGTTTVRSAQSGGLTLNVFAAGFTTGNVFEPGATVPLYIGALRSGSPIDQPDDGSVSVTVQIDRPDGNQDTIDATVTNGSERVEYQTDANLTGDYTVTVTADNGTASGTDFFDTGRQEAMPFFDGSADPGEQVTVPIYVRRGGDPVAGESVSVDVTMPGGSQRTETVTTDSGGIATLSVTPQTTGRLSFSTTTDRSTLWVTNARTLVPEFNLRDQRAGDPATLVGHLRGTGGALSNTQFRIRVTDVTDYSSQQEVANELVTTDDNGLFEYSWSTPAGEERDYEYQFETTDGDRIVPPEFARVRTLVQGGQTGPSLDAEFADFRTPLDGDNTVEVTVTDDTGPVSNATVELLLAYSFNPVPFDRATLTTDGSGQASYTFSVPSDAPDGADMQCRAGVVVDGTEVTDDDSSRLVGYETDEVTGGDVVPGQSVDIGVSTTEPNSDTAVSGVTTQMTVSQDGPAHDLWATGTLTTDADGERTTSVSVPTSAEAEFGVNFLNDYEGIFLTRSPRVDRFDATVNGLGNLVPGEQTSVTVTDASGSERPAYVALEGDDRALTGVATPGNPATIDVPGDVSQGSLRGFNAVAAFDGDGRAQVLSVDASVTSDISLSVSASPTNPRTGESVQFDASGTTSAAGTIQTVEWDFTDDGSFDATGTTVTHTYDQSGTYRAAVRVTDSAGNQRTGTVQVTVQSGAGLSQYANAQGVVDTGGLQTALSDWASGDLSTTQLLQVLDAWGSGTTVN